MALVFPLIWVALFLEGEVRGMQRVILALEVKEEVMRLFEVEAEMRQALQGLSP